MKNLLLIATLLAVAISAACKSDWDIARANAPMAGLPEKLPTEYKNRYGTKVFSDKPVTDEEMGYIAAGIAEQLAHSRQYANTLGWQKYKNPDEYNVLLVDSTVLSETPEILNCILIDTYAGRAAGTVAGAWGNVVKDPIIIVPRQKDYGRCGNLFKNAVKHESEHVRLTNNMTFFQVFQGANDIHPIFETWRFKSNNEMERIQ